MRDIVIKVLEGSDELVGTSLRLERKQNSTNYICKITGLEIIDKWDELKYIKTQLQNSNFKIKFDVLLFIDSSEQHPLFISKIQKIRNQSETILLHKTSLFFSKLWKIKNNKLAIS
jgi:hypothetical protein